ncbi:MAG TPA: excisionase family DNA-binding protein [Polyangiaceae bacterium]|nr:excisionase family DNA-binding protein [Polyangiaceae bacterium]
MNNEQDLLSADQAAHRLGVSEDYVRRAARDRRLASVRLGKRVLFRPQDIEDYVAAHLREPVEA